jgi:hypothetical protein
MVDEVRCFVRLGISVGEGGISRCKRREQDAILREFCPYS